MAPWILWVLFAIAMFAGEIMTTGFFLMWIGVGALAGAALAFFGLDLAFQLLGFVAASGVLVFSSRRIFKQMLDQRADQAAVPSNVDALIDKTGIVVKTINNQGEGLVKLKGETWSAVSNDEHPIGEGKRVVIVKIEGVKLVVMEQP